MKKSPKTKTNSGFTLLEIMVALGVLTFGLVALYTAQGRSIRASLTSERTQVAAFLAKQIMAEKQIELEKDLEKGSVPEDDSEEVGEFQSPFEDFRWKFEVRKIEFVITGSGGGASDSSQEEIDKKEKENIPSTAKRSLAQAISKQISDATREVKVTISWGEFGDERSFSITKHIARL